MKISDSALSRLSCDILVDLFGCRRGSPAAVSRLIADAGVLFNRRLRLRCFVNSGGIADAKRFSRNTQRTDYTGQIGRHINLGRAAVRNRLERFQSLESDNFVRRVRRRQSCKSVRLCLIDQLNRSGAAFRKRDLRVSFGFRGKDLRPLVAFRPRNDRLLMCLCFQHFRRGSP